jgi:hypothetical protein
MKTSILLSTTRAASFWVGSSTGLLLAWRTSVVPIILEKLRSVRIDDEEYHERYGIATLGHVGLRKQVIVRVRVHGFGIANVGPVQVEDEVAEGGERENS